MSSLSPILHSWECRGRQGIPHCAHKSTITAPLNPHKRQQRKLTAASAAHSWTSASSNEPSVPGESQDLDRLTVSKQTSSAAAPHALINLFGALENEWEDLKQSGLPCCQENHCFRRDSTPPIRFQRAAMNFVVEDY